MSLLSLRLERHVETAPRFAECLTSCCGLACSTHPPRSMAPRCSQATSLWAQCKADMFFHEFWFESAHNRVPGMAAAHSYTSRATNRAPWHRLGPTTSLQLVLVPASRCASARQRPLENGGRCILLPPNMVAMCLPSCHLCVCECECEFILKEKH